MSKGGDFETLTGKTWSLWLTGGEDRTQFIRSKSSGGWEFRRQNPDQRQVGDLQPNGIPGDAFRGLFFFECKHYKEISFWKLFSGRKHPGEILSWWKKAEAEGREANLIPLLVMRQNFMPVLLGSSPQFLDRFPRYTGPRITLAKEGDSISLVDQESFMSVIAPEEFLKVGRWVFLN